MLCDLLELGLLDLVQRLLLALPRASSVAHLPGTAHCRRRREGGGREREGERMGSACWLGSARGRRHWMRLRRTGMQQAVTRRRPTLSRGGQQQEDGNAGRDASTTPRAGGQQPRGEGCTFCDLAHISAHHYLYSHACHLSLHRYGHPLACTGHAIHPHVLDRVNLAVSQRSWLNSLPPLSPLCVALCASSSLCRPTFL